MVKLAKSFACTSPDRDNTPDGSVRWLDPPLFTTLVCNSSPVHPVEVPRRCNPRGGSLRCILKGSVALPLATCDDGTRTPASRGPEEGRMRTRETDAAGRTPAGEDAQPFPFLSIALRRHLPHSLAQSCRPTLPALLGAPAPVAVQFARIHWQTQLKASWMTPVRTRAPSARAPVHAPAPSAASQSAVACAP